ncbi:hypothetical protein PLICRDRAFT_696273 [Plicaturopsis crispa FD-325 SS-3]|nr:hypothetical protein PLICRDRAFT_696273 [Plicaturopsis crispa FD-325 SS-3]
MAVNGAIDLSTVADPAMRNILGQIIADHTATKQRLRAMGNELAAKDEEIRALRRKLKSDIDEVRVEKDESIEELRTELEDATETLRQEIEEAVDEAKEEMESTQEEASDTLREEIEEAVDEAKDELEGQLHEREKDINFVLRLLVDMDTVLADLKRVILMQGQIQALPP